MKSLLSSSMAIFSFSYVYRNSTSWPKLFFRAPFLPSATKLRRLCFHRRVSVHREGGDVWSGGAWSWRGCVPGPEGCLLPGGACSRGGVVPGPGGGLVSQLTLRQTLRER